MMAPNDNEAVIPVVSEEVHANAVPVVTGGVRVTKHTDTHEEILQQELRKGRVEVKRVRTERVVDGPQAPQRNGNTVIIPVVSEVLTVQKRWVVVEEIHVTQFEESETVRQTVPVNHESARVERVDEAGNVVDVIDEPEAHPAASLLSPQGSGPVEAAKEEPAADDETPPRRRVLSGTQSMLRKSKPKL